MALVTCTRCGREAEPLPFPPYPDELGARIQRSVCQTCWREYMGRQTMVINEYRLDLMDPRAQDILTRDMVEFLNLPGQEGEGKGTAGGRTAEGEAATAEGRATGEEARG